MLTTVRVRRSLAAAVTIGLVASGGAAAATVDRAKASGPTDYSYDKEWIYSTDASELPVAEVGPDGRVYAIAPLSGYGVETSRVRVYDTAGVLQTSWDVPIQNQSELDFDPAGNLLITDYAGQIVSDINPSVQRWSPTGTLLGTYYLPSYQNTAADVARAPDGSFWVSDATRDVIHHFTADGTYLTAIGGTGTAAGTFDSPWGLGVLSNGNLVVADRENDRIQVVTPAGAPVAAWGQAGSGNGQFINGPGAVSVRGDDTIYVTDTTSRIQVFSASGAFLGLVNPVTKRNSTMPKVYSIAFGADRTMYVAGQQYPFENGIARYLNATITPPAPPPVPTPPTQPPGAKGVASIKKPAKALKTGTKGKLALTVKCSAAGPCAGKVTVKVKKKSIAKAVSYSLAAGATGKAKIKLTAKGKKLIPRKGTVTVTASTGDKSVKIRVRR